MIDKLGYNEQRSQTIKYNYFTIGLPNSHPCFYDQIWLIDAGDQYIPVLIQNINTCSCFAEWYCGIYLPRRNDAEVI